MLVSFGNDVSAGYWLIGFSDSTEIRRTHDGGFIDRIAKLLSKASHVVDRISGSGQDQLRNVFDGEEIVPPLGSRLRHLDFRTPAEDGYFVAAFNDGHYELWDGNGSPTLLRNLEFGLRGYLTLFNGLMLVWYDNGNAYVIDPAWLARIGGDPGRLPATELLDSLCNGLFAKSSFDRQAWANRKQVETRACVH